MDGYIHLYFQSLTVLLIPFCIIQLLTRIFPFIFLLNIQYLYGYIVLDYRLLSLVNRISLLEVLQEGIRIHIFLYFALYNANYFFTLNPNKAGGGHNAPPPLKKFENFLQLLQRDSFLSSFAHLLSQNLQKSDMPLRSYVTFYVSASGSKQDFCFVLCTNPIMQNIIPQIQTKQFIFLF